MNHLRSTLDLSEANYLQVSPSCKLREQNLQGGSMIVHCEQVLYECQICRYALFQTQNRGGTLNLK